MAKKTTQRIVVVCEDHENDQASTPYLVDLGKLPKNHSYRLAVEEGLESGQGGEVDADLSYDYSTTDKGMLAARVELPFTGTIVGAVKIFTD